MGIVMPRRLIVWGALGAGVLALALGLFFGLQQQDGAGTAESLLAVVLPDATGHEQRIDQWRGKVLVVNFWATWCGPCREEMPQFVKTQQALGARGLQFVGIAVDEPAKVRAFVDEIHLNYPALVGGFGAMELSRVYGNRLMALPFTVVVDRAGRIVHRQLGPIDPAKLQSVISKIL